MKKLYCFDFDGTLTKKDTMFLFLRFYDRSKFYRAFFRHIPVFTFLKFKLMDAEKVKKSFISAVLKGEKYETIEQRSKDFFDEFYPEIVREEALQFIQNRDLKNTHSLLVTASLDIWVKPFAEKWNMELLATQACFRDGIFTGEFNSLNCNGNEKVCRIKSAIKDRKFDKTIAFGDSDGDKEMLEWADEGHYRFFHT